MLTLAYIDALFLAILLLLVGVTIGVILGIFFVQNHMDNALFIQRTFGYFFALNYVLLQTYTVLTQGQPLDWFFSAAGFVVVGHAIGVNLSQYIPTLPSRNIQK